MKPQPLPDTDILRKLLRYESDTGKLFWLPRNGLQSFNARRAETEAFTCVSATGYKTGRILGKSRLAHRIAWKLHYGEEPPENIDHINGVTDDNRIVNLRQAGHDQNTWNQKKRNTNSSGVKGVRWHKASKSWIAVITKNRKDYWLGCFKTKKEAIAARLNAEQELFGDFMRKNELEVV
jgi:hypothetical protein